MTGVGRPFPGPEGRGKRIRGRGMPRHGRGCAAGNGQAVLCARRDFFRAARFSWMIPFFAALSSAEVTEGYSFAAPSLSPFGE